MLYEFASRLAQMERARDERGFTLIELLVVIVVGMLAAIAIPVFLAQRTSAYEAAAQSYVRNGAAAATACASAAQGSFAACSEETLTGTFNLNQTTGVEPEVITTEAGRWVARSQHAQGGTRLPVRLRQREGHPAGSQVLTRSTLHPTPLTINRRQRITGARVSSVPHRCPSRAPALISSASRKGNPCPR